MAAPACSDQQFIQVWNKHLSSTKVAEELGTTVTNVRGRRRRIEKRHNIRLGTADSRPAYNSALISDDRIEIKVNILDGVVMVGGDAHYWPGTVPTMHRAYCYLAKKLKPVVTVNNGDAFDGSSISRFPDIGWEDKPDVRGELENLQDRLGEIVKAAPAAIRPWNAGNHCLRFEMRLAASVPQYKKVTGFHLKDHFPSWLPAWFVTINEGEESHTEIRHREKGGIHAGYNNALHSGVNIVTGHDHRADAVRFDDRRGHRWSVRTGMMADSPRDQQFANYLEGRKPNWQSAFAVLTYRGGRLMAPEHCWRVDEETVEFRGEFIKV